MMTCDGDSSAIDAFKIEAKHVTRKEPLHAMDIGTGFRISVPKSWEATAASGSVLWPESWPEPWLKGPPGHNYAGMQGNTTLALRMIHLIERKGGERAICQKQKLTESTTLAGVVLDPPKVPTVESLQLDCGRARAEVETFRGQARTSTR